MTPIKLCECGCGRATSIAKSNNAQRGYVKGQPQRFLKGHRKIRPFLALSNQRFGRLVVLWYLVGGRWQCVCDCGNTSIVTSYGLTSGQSQSCSCLHNEIVTRHGHAVSAEHRSLTYNSWASMIQRCTNPNIRYWNTYGGAGVTVCKAWLTFEGFLASMGERPAGTSLGRILDMGNYEPGNTFWQTVEEQNLAKRNHNALLKWAASRAVATERKRA